MPPKRKGKAASPAANKRAKAEEKRTKAEEEPPVSLKSPGAKTPGGKGLKSVSDVWSSKEYVSDGRMGQEGFGALADALGIEHMTCEALYLIFVFSPSRDAVTDVFTVCESKAAMQSALDGLGCRTMSELPAKLRAKCAHMQTDFGPPFPAFFRWLFEMGKAVAAVNNDVAAHAVRTVPLNEGLQLLEAVLPKWRLTPTLKAFCVDKYAQPFSKDLWTQIGRFAHMTQTGQIVADLSNYDDDASGGGSAWPCAIDDFVEFVQAGAGAPS